MAYPLHHLWTTISWYRYQEVFESIEPELRARQCTIAWDSRAVAPLAEPDDAPLYSRVA